MPSGIWILSAIVGEPSQPWGTTKVAMKYDPLGAVSGRAVTCARDRQGRRDEIATGPHSHVSISLGFDAECADRYPGRYLLGGAMADPSAFVSAGLTTPDSATR